MLSSPLPLCILPNVAMNTGGVSSKTPSGLRGTSTKQEVRDSRVTRSWSEYGSPEYHRSVWIDKHAGGIILPILCISASACSLLCFQIWGQNLLSAAGRTPDSGCAATEIPLWAASQPSIRSDYGDIIDDPSGGYARDYKR